MANRYWVGGSADWNATAGTKWSLTSGGSGGEAVPTSADDVFLDGNSGAVTINITANVNFNNFDCTGFTGTLDNLYYNYMNCYGTVYKYSTGMTIGNGYYSYHRFYGNCTLTSNGKTLGVLVPDTGSTVTLADAAIVNSSMQIVSTGNFTTGGYNVTIGNFYMQGTGTVNLGASNIEITGTTFQLSSSGGSTFNAGTSTIKFTIANNNVYFDSYTGYTFYNVWFAIVGSSTSFVNFNLNAANCTFNEFKATVPVNPYGIKVTSATTMTVGSFNVNGTGCYGFIRLLSSTAGSAFTINDSAGTNSCTYLQIKDMTVGGGATWTTSESTDISGNTGWTFTGTACVYNRYWVGGTATWNSTVGTKWATTSGGSGGASVPTLYDDVFFDANSGSGTVTYDSSVDRAVRNLDFTGFTGTFVNSGGSYFLLVFGTTFKFVAGMTVTSTPLIRFSDTTGLVQSVTSAGKTFTNIVSIYNENSYNHLGSVKLIDAFVCTSGLHIDGYYGKLDCNNQNITASWFYMNQAPFDKGSGTLTLTGYDGIYYPYTWYVNYNGIAAASSGAIKFTNTSNNNASFYYGYYGHNPGLNDYSGVQIWFDRGASTGDNKVYQDWSRGANAGDLTKIGDLKDTGTVQHNLLIEYYAARYVSVTSLTLNGGSCANRITLKSMTNGSAALINDTTGTNAMTYLAVKDITFQGGATYSVTNYVDLGNNTGVTFTTSCPTTNIKLWNALADASVKNYDSVVRASIKTFNGLA